MKSLYLIFFLACTFLCHSQQSNNAVIKFDNKDYVISYPPEFHLKSYQPDFILFTAFVITRMHSTNESEFPVISLHISDYSATGMGPKSSLEEMIKDKNVIKGKTKTNNIEFQKISYEENDIKIVEYIFLKNSIIYDLKGFISLNESKDKYILMEQIMDSFDLNL
jgi:hypothetical protein